MNILQPSNNWIRRQFVSLRYKNNNFLLPSRKDKKHTAISRESFHYWNMRYWLVVKTFTITKRLINHSMNVWIFSVCTNGLCISLHWLHISPDRGTKRQWLFYYAAIVITLSVLLKLNRQLKNGLSYQANRRHDVISLLKVLCCDRKKMKTEVFFLLIDERHYVHRIKVHGKGEYTLLWMFIDKRL